MKEPTCYFCNKPRKMLRNDMKVYVCEEHEPEETTQPSLPLDESAEDMRRLAAKPVVNYTQNFMDVKTSPRAYTRIPAGVYWWRRKSDGEICWRSSREAAEEAASLT